MSEDAQAIVDEVKSTFDFLSAVQNVPESLEDVKRNIVRVYRDRETGRALGGVTTHTGAAGQEVQERFGVLGELSLKLEEKKLLEEVIRRADELEQEPESLKTYEDRLAVLKKEITALKRKAAPLQKKLDESALDFEVRYLPPAAIKIARREARKHLGIKKVTDDNADEYVDEYNAQVLSLATVSVEEVATGSKNLGLSAEEARAAYDFLPPSEVKRLVEFVDGIVFRADIAQKLSFDADF
ncbi:hypothetical protein [Microbacterium sp. No. 7]|uniref:hypothetical protein n=1 Tax=Microbacterium sp. No. 7 TaxID=1714373 RepID=UPI0006ED069F|nr:hypothetical protein [Microbacterium sp. No. 7]ALJ19580.1 hypothetical protein AOA12_06520 [Microbacterium sp. No. 7]